MTIRKSPGIKGIKIGERDHHISLFADGIVLFLTNLKNTITALIHIMEQFGRFSGYKINNSKSILLLLNDQERKAPLSHTQFTNKSGGFSYLGIKITPNIDNIVPTNYDPLLKGVMESLDKWSTMPTGRHSFEQLWFNFSTDHPSWVDIEKEELLLHLQSYIYSAEVKIL